MYTSITQSDYDRLAKQMGKNALDQMLARDGVEIIPDHASFEVTPVNGAEQTMDETDNTDFSVQPAEGGPDNADETDAPAPQGLSALSSIAARQKQSIGNLYDQITQDIQKRYRAPDVNDLLMAIGMGMMSPPGENDEGGFRGALMRGLRGIGTYAQSRQAYKSDINKMLSNIDIQKAKSLADLEERYLTGAAAAMKPKTPTSMVSVGPDAVARNKFTGNEILTAPLDAVEKLQTALKDPTKSPQDKLDTMRNFDKKFGYGAAKAYANDIYAGE